MSKANKTLEKLRSANADANIRFDDARALLQRLGFRERIKGSHHIFTRRGIETLIDYNRARENVSHTKSAKSVKSSSDSTSRYSVQIGWSDADQAFIAAVPELSGCLADGATYEQALRAIEQEIEIWLETARLEGWKIPKPKTFKTAAAVASAA